MRNIIILTGVAVALGCTAFGTWRLDALRISYGSDIFFAPLRLMREIYPAAILAALLSFSAIVAGIVKRSLWFFLPIGLVILGSFWMAACLVVIRMLGAVPQ